MKPDPQLLSLASYPFQAEVPTRFGDMDVIGHLNNVAICALYEEARSRFLRERIEFGTLSRADSRAFLASVQVNYLREGRYPEAVQIGVGVGRVGNSSYELRCAAFQKGVCIGTCTALAVTVSETGRPQPIPVALRERLEAARLGVTAAN